MNAHLLSRLALLGAVALLFETRAGLAQSPPPAAAPALCVYQDRSYSEGATICPQTRYMLMCSAEETRLVWKAVADRSLADRCLRPTIAADAPIRPLRRQRIARSVPPPSPIPGLPAAGRSAKCFTFNNRHYCE